MFILIYIPEAIGLITEWMSCALMELLYTHLSLEGFWVKRNLTKTKMLLIMVFEYLEEVRGCYIYLGDV